MSLLEQVRALLRAEPLDLVALTKLLVSPSRRAEEELARLLVREALEAQTPPPWEDRDPAQRRRAVGLLEHLLDERSRHHLLQRLCRDPDGSVRRSAERARDRLAGPERALPDTRFPPRARHSPHRGGYNPTGWSFGLGVPALLLARGEVTPTRAAPEPWQRALAALPPLPDEEALAAWLGVPRRALRSWLAPTGTEGFPYRTIEIPRASGGTRTLAAPVSSLARAQRKILRELLDHLPAHPAAHGFVRGRSIVTNARAHLGAAVLVKLDLRDFFPTVHYRRVAGFFAQLGYAPPVSALLAGVCTWRQRSSEGKTLGPGVLPQGAPTSPALANLLCRRLDARLTGLARTLGGAYTRYADDLTFSFSREPEQGLGHFFWWVSQVCLQEGFEERSDKRRVLRPSQQQRVTGVVTNASPSVPREERRRLRAVLHNCHTHGVESQARGRPRFREYLLGYAAYVAMVNPQHGEPLLAQARALFSAG